MRAGTLAPWRCRRPSSGSRARPSRSSTSSFSRLAPARCSSGSPPAASARATSTWSTAGLPEPLPLVLGHEASGVVVETGPGVERLRPGDHVVLALVPSCGDCESCRQGRPNFCELGGAHGGDGDARGRDLTTLRRRRPAPPLQLRLVVRRARRRPRVGRRPDQEATCSLETAALVGCAALTGWGAVTRIAGVEEGASVAVWGCGGVGLSALQAARLAGAGAIVAVDTRPEKLELAERLGATDTVQSGPGRRHRPPRPPRHGRRRRLRLRGDRAARRRSGRPGTPSARAERPSSSGSLPRERASRSTPGVSSTRRRSRGASSARRRSRRTSRGSSTSIAGGELRLEELVSDRLRARAPAGGARPPARRATRSVSSSCSTRAAGAARPGAAAARRAGCGSG